MQLSTNFDDLIWKRASLPNKISDSEDILVVTREDLIILVGKAIVLFLVFFVFMIIRVFILGISANSFYLSLFDGVMFGVNVILITYFTLIFHNYYLSIQIITTERLIDIDQHGLFRREVNTLPIDNIEDVTYKQNGFIGTIFNFGNVVVQTAGEQGVSVNSEVSGFVFDNVPDPSTLSSRLIDLYQGSRAQDLKNAAKANAEAMKKAFSGDSKV